MKYFFSGIMKGNYSQIVDSLVALKFGKIIGEKYKLITIGFNNTKKCKDAYDMFVCGYLTRGSSCYKVETCDEKFIKYLTKVTSSELGLYFEDDENLIIKLFNQDGNLISKKEEETINEFLKRNMSFPLSKKIGGILDYSKYLEGYQKEIEDD